MEEVVFEKNEKHSAKFKVFQGIFGNDCTYTFFARKY